MTETINDRIISLLKTKNIDDTALAALIGKDRSTVYRITQKQSVPSKTTVKLIAVALDADFNHLMYGTSPDAFATDKSSFSKALELLEQQLKRKDDQIADLLRLLNKVNFRKASENAYNFKMFPGLEQLGVVSGANHA